MIFVYLAILAVVARTLAVDELRPVLPAYLGMELAYLILYTLALWQLRRPGWLLHLYLIIQCALVLWMQSLWPEFDFVVLLYLLLVYQVALLFRDLTRWVWVGVLIFLTSGSLIYFLGLLPGLAISLTTIVGEIILLAFVISGQEIVATQLKSQALLDELQVTNQQLQQYAGQVEELAAMQERNRLARELHDTVSQLIFSISLLTRSAQLLMEKEPERVPEILMRLQRMTADALSQLRSFITQLRPPA